MNHRFVTCAEAGFDLNSSKQSNEQSNEQYTNRSEGFESFRPHSLHPAILSVQGTAIALRYCGPCDRRAADVFLVIQRGQTSSARMLSSQFCSMESEVDDRPLLPQGLNLRNAKRRALHVDE